mmetsp:Transcript_41305/g.93040  ORF Transcript_41305/g.93040 Transcript_41305/m.93040 type:complete len:261 (-) Transcript_41305:147-929(-)
MHLTAAGNAHVAGDGVDVLRLQELGGGRGHDVPADPSPPVGLDLLDHAQLRGVDTVLFEDVAGRVGERDGVAAEGNDLLRHRKRHVPGPGDQHALALERILFVLKKGLGEVGDPEARGVREGRRPAPEQPPPALRPHLVRPLPLPVHVPDLARPHAEAHPRVVDVRPKVLGELVHEALAEALDLGLGLVLGVEVGPARGAARRAARERVHAQRVERRRLEHQQRRRRNLFRTSPFLFYFQRNLITSDTGKEGARSVRRHM